MSRHAVISKLAAALKKVVDADHKKYMTVANIGTAFSALERAGLVEDLLICEYKRLPEVVDLVMRVVKREVETVTEVQGDALSDLQVIASDLKIMLWAFGKINDKKRIERAYVQAMKALG